MSHCRKYRKHCNSEEHCEDYSSSEDEYECSPELPCRKKLPKCAKLCVKPGCYKCRELKKYECKWSPPKYELRYVRKQCKKPVAVVPRTSCCCSLAMKYNKN